MSSSGVNDCVESSIVSSPAGNEFENLLFDNNGGIFPTFLEGYCDTQDDPNSSPMLSSSADMYLAQTQSTLMRTPQYEGKKLEPLESKPIAIANGSPTKGGRKRACGSQTPGSLNSSYGSNSPDVFFTPCGTFNSPYEDPSVYNSLSLDKMMINSGQSDVHGPYCKRPKESDWKGKIETLRTYSGSSDGEYTATGETNAKETKIASKRVAQQKTDPDMPFITTACAEVQMPLSIEKNQSTGRFLKLKWVSKPASVLRPSYPREGSRGAMKTEEGTSVEIKADLRKGQMTVETLSVALITAVCVTKEKGKVIQHPHFSATAITDQPHDTISIDGVDGVCIKRSVTPGQAIKMEFGIKRAAKTEGVRTNKLTRCCQIVIRMYSMNQVDGVWRVTDCAQLVTDTITCEQQQGAPTITAMSHTEYSSRGGMTCAVKGKHLMSKTTPPDAVVTFNHKESGWTKTANIYHIVTTKESMAFEIPVFRPEPEFVPFLTHKATVEVIVSIDKRVSETKIEFTYVLGDDVYALYPPTSIYDDLDPVTQGIQMEYNSPEAERTLAVRTDVMSVPMQQQSYYSEQLSPELYDNNYPQESGFCASISANASQGMDVVSSQSDHQWMAPDHSAYLGTNSAAMIS